MSHGYGGGFSTEFSWCGTTDPAPVLAVSVAVEAFEAIGFELIMRTNLGRLQAAVGFLTTRWGTRVIGVGGTTMAAVELPAALRDAPPQWMHERLFEMGIEVPVGAVGVVGMVGAVGDEGGGNGSGDGGGGEEVVTFVRISSQMYNTMRDYEVLADGIDEVCVQWKGMRHGETEETAEKATEEAMGPQRAKL